MKKLVLNVKESQELIENGSIEIERNGYTMLVEYIILILIKTKKKVI